MFLFADFFDYVVVTVTVTGWSRTCLYHSFLSCQSVCFGHNWFHGPGRSLYWLKMMEEACVGRGIFLVLLLFFWPFSAISGPQKEKIQQVQQQQQQRHWNECVNIPGKNLNNIHGNTKIHTQGFWKMKIQVGNVHISAGRAQTAAPVLCLFTSVINGDDTHTSAVQTWGTFFLNVPKRNTEMKKPNRQKGFFKISMIEKSWNTSSCSNSLRGWGRVGMKNKRSPGAWAFNFYIWCDH